MDEQRRKRAIWAWTTYDWANSAFATTIMAAVLPVYYTSVAAANLPPNIATAYWGFTTSISALLAAIISPILGAMADFSGAKKRFLAIFMMLGVTGTALLYFVRTGDWLLGSLFFILGNIGFAGSLVYYDALLPHVARPDELDQVSSRGYAMGYIGGGVLLAINLAMILFVPGFFPPEQEAEITQLMTRMAFLTVAVWWFIFTLPLLKYVSEPKRRILPGEEKFNPVQASFSRLSTTFKEIRNYRDLSIFLLAFWVYANGIGTIITMATAYGNEIGIGQTTLIGTLLMVQFLAAPFAILFGRLAKRIGPKKAIYLSLSVYTLISIMGYFLQFEWQFWALGALVATVQGGSQALSRSVMGRMIPKSKSAEFFGFFSVFEKFANIAGPFLFGVVSTLTGASRLSIVSLIFFFGVGMVLLSRVNIERGMKVAELEEQTLIDQDALVQSV
ncbi:MAG: MFS transporter [Chloroflexota bacterium]|nr:MAG: MFS transporter [Bellilinea sp.]